MHFSKHHAHLHVVHGRLRGHGAFVSAHRIKIIPQTVFPTARSTLLRIDEEEAHQLYPGQQVGAKERPEVQEVNTGAVRIGRGEKSDKAEIDMFFHTMVRNVVKYGMKIIITFEDFWEGITHQLAKQYNVDAGDDGDARKSLATTRRVCQAGGFKSDGHLPD
jgi:hypothetical protein